MRATAGSSAGGGPYPIGSPVGTRATPGAHSRALRIHGRRRADGRAVAGPGHRRDSDRSSAVIAAAVPVGSACSVQVLDRRSSAHRTHCPVGRQVSDGDQFPVRGNRRPHPTQIVRRHNRRGDRAGRGPGAGGGGPAGGIVVTAGGPTATRLSSTVPAGAAQDSGERPFGRGRTSVPVGSRCTAHRRSTASAASISSTWRSCRARVSRRAGIR